MYTVAVTRTVYGTLFWKQRQSHPIANVDTMVDGHPYDTLPSSHLANPLGCYMLFHCKE